ncbi:MAG: hypothetical protein ACUVYA_04680 [Planctomycetota bacterium]
MVPSRAEFLLYSWGSAHRVQLEREGSAPVLRLDPPWLEEAYPASRIRPHQHGRILLEAEGFVRLLSEAFGWLGASDLPGGLPRERTRVRLPGQAFTDSEGRAELVDGDFEYGFEIRRTHWSLADPQSCYPDRHEAVLESEETVLRMRRHEPQRLEIVLDEGGKWGQTQD